MRIYDIRFPIITISLAIFFSSLINFAYGQEVNETSKTYTYENSTEGIRFHYPSYWGNVSLNGGCISQPCGIPLDPTNQTTLGFNFMIIRMYDKSSGLRPTCDCDTLTEFVRWAYPSIQNAIPDFTFMNDNQTTIGKNNSAWQIEFSGSTADQSGHTKKLVVFIKSNNKFYTLSFNPFTDESWVKQLPEFKKLVDSIEFLPIQIPKKPSFMNASEMEQSKPNLMLESNPTALQILSHNSFTDSIGYFHVVGEIKNNSPSTAEFVQITGTFYDINNAVVGTQFTYTNPSDISSGATAPFDLILTSASVSTSLIDHYNLQASSG
jgi:hypothetical protein